MRRNWSAIGVEFIASNLTVEEFASKNGLPYDTLRKQVTKNKWLDKRRTSGAQVAHKAVEIITDDKATTLAHYDNRMLSIVNGLALQVEAGVVCADEPNKVKILSAAAKDLQHIYRLVLGASTENQSVKSVEDFEAFVNEKLSGLGIKHED